LRRGKHVNTDVELAIWGILANRSNLLESIDRPLAAYIESEQQKLFPDLFDQVFS